MRILTIGIDEIDRSRFGKVETEPVLNKPKGGCLWGSTMIRSGSGYSSGWKRWTSMEEYKDYDFGVSYCLSRKAKILEIDSLERYLEVMQEYSRLVYSGIDDYCLDFQKIAKDFDAFHLTDKAFWRMRSLYIIKDSDGRVLRDFYSWDAESWVIFNPDCVNWGSVRNEGNLNGGCWDECY